MSPSNPNPSIALFGATGGTGLCILSQILTHDPLTHLSILCRTPSKLSTQYPVSTYPNLRLIQGDIYDAAAVKNTLLNAHTGRAVDIAISSLGMGMVRDGWWWRFSDPEICFKGTKAVLDGLSELEGEGKGLEERRAGEEREKTKIIVLSTTGISDKGRDIPIRMMPLYYGLLGTPHKDKKRMEEEIVRRGREEGRRWVVVRPSWLLDGAREGRRVRVGWEVPVGEDVGRGEGKTAGDNKEIGVAIAREDVGKWVFEEGVRDGGKREWEGRFVSLTY
ncbi:Fungal specific transcription factor domain-containing protein [Rutstroemia sp. NJR-2017a BVV2]|nr:Fungal specific transcription factor domain-containing protein [Rutstroemia sp. NJR-2017a BVV2]